MAINKLLIEIAQIEKIIEGWRGSQMSTIEREIVLEKLRTIYEQIIFMDNETLEEQKTQQQPEAEIYGLNESEDAEQKVSFNIPNFEQQEEELVYIDEEDSQIETEDDVEDLASLNPNADKQTVAYDDNLDQEIKDMLAKSKLNDSAINSLYGQQTEQAPLQAEQDDTDDDFEIDMPEQQTESIEQVEIEPVVEKVLPKPTTIRTGIGMNDKYLMTRNMFDSDSRLFEQTINDLDQMSDINDALIYINDKFNWNPDDNSVKLLISLLEEKLL